jgi:hypothetical protein
MPQRQTDAKIKKQLNAVGERLSNDRAKGEERLALLRRQAQLGDERDEAALRARRAAREDEARG